MKSRATTFISLGAAAVFVTMYCVWSQGKARYSFYQGDQELLAVIKGDNVTSTADYMHLFAKVPSTIPGSKSGSRMEIPQSWQTIGCFQLSKLPTGLPKSTTSHSILHCLDICQRKTPLVLYAEDGRCYCSNSYHAFNTAQICDATSSKGSKPHLWVAHPDNVTGILIEQTKQASRDCYCTTPSCQDISCEERAKDLCWSGPALEDIKSHEGDCTVDQYTVVQFSKHVNYCLEQPDMIGFWPVKNCLTFKSKTGLRERSYTITPPQSKRQTVQVRIFPRDGQQRVVISGYYRSGSTLTSHLFLSHPRAKYFFETLHPVAHDKLHPEANLPIVTLDSAFHYQVQDAVTNLMNCQLYKLPVAAFTTFPVDKDYMSKNCDLSKNSWLDCLSIEMNACVSRPLLTAKFIRIKTESLTSLIQTSLPDLKIISLLRDPRAMYRSWKAGPDMRKKYQLVKGKELQKLLPTIKTLCNEQESDYRAIQKMDNKIYHNQTTILHYEDLVFSTTQTVTEVYRNIGLGEPPLSVKESYNSLIKTSSTARSNAARESYFSVKRNVEGRKIAYAWKSDLSWHEVQEIDKVCSDSYTITGYQPVASEAQLRNLTNFHRTFAHK